MSESLIIKPENERIPDFEDLESLKKDYNKRVVIFGTNRESMPLYQQLEQFEDSNAIRVDFTRQVPYIDYAFWGLRPDEETPATPPDVVIAFPHMRGELGTWDGDVYTPFAAIEELVEATGCDYIKLNDGDLLDDETLEYITKVDK